MRSSRWVIAACLVVGLVGQASAILVGEGWMTAGGRGGGDRCFPAGAKIATPYGEQNIETVRVGDVVLSYDVNLRKTTTAKVTAVIRNPQRPYGVLSLKDGTELEVTPPHRFYIEGQWKAAGELKEGDMVTKMINTGIGFSPTEVAVNRFDAPKNIAGGAGSCNCHGLRVNIADVYNLETEPDHNYIANGVLVHDNTN